MKFFAIKVPRGNEYSVEQTYSLLSNLSAGKKKSLFHKSVETYSLEFVCYKQQIYFVIGVPDDQVDFFRAQLLAQFKDALIEDLKRPFEQELEISKDDWFYTQLVLSKDEYLPIKTTEDFKDTDPMSSVLATLAKTMKGDDFCMIQFVLSSAGKSWQKNFSSLATTGGGKTEGGDYKAHPKKVLIEKKIAHEGFYVYARILTNKESALSAITGSFGAYSDPMGNSITAKAPGIFSKKKILNGILNRSQVGHGQVMNLQEISSIWHFPSVKVTVTNIAWGRELFHEPPADLPVAEGLTPEEKKDISFFAKTVFKNQNTIFGIKGRDRQRHMYIIGKTGTGKTTLIDNLAIESIRKGEGVAIIDPHGDLSHTILDFIPKSRVNDVCYFNPADPEYYYTLNPLEVFSPEQRELVASGIISIFKKLYGHSWGPRLEYILRNVLLTLTLVPDTTLTDVPRLLTDDRYRAGILERINDPVMLRFWRNEYDPLDKRLKQEAISPILNKVGQFISSPMMRRVISSPKSKVNLEKIMNEGKIIVCDLSQGRMGEDNSSLLGAMIITKIQLAAMNRAFIPEEERRPFTLFVDEFQNFATDAFIKILSEARKYKLNLAVANQYMSQIDPQVLNAILGNVGTLISFSVGAQDSSILDREFGIEFTSDDFVSLEKFQILLKLSIDWQISRPFYANTLPLPTNVSGQKDKIIKISRDRFGKKRGEDFKFRANDAVKAPEINEQPKVSGSESRSQESSRNKNTYKFEKKEHSSKENNEKKVEDERSSNDRDRKQKDRQKPSFKKSSKKKNTYKYGRKDVSSQKKQGENPDKPKFEKTEKANNSDGMNDKEIEKAAAVYSNPFLEGAKEKFPAD